MCLGNNMAYITWMHIDSNQPSFPGVWWSVVCSQVRILLMLWQAGDWQIQPLVMVDHPILHG